MNTEPQRRTLCGPVGLKRWRPFPAGVTAVVATHEDLSQKEPLLISAVQLLSRV